MNRGRLQKLQENRPLVWGTRGRRFKSAQPDKKKGFVQWAKPFLFGLGDPRISAGKSTGRQGLLEAIPRVLPDLTYYPVRNYSLQVFLHFCYQIFSQAIKTRTVVLFIGYQFDANWQPLWKVFINQGYFYKGRPDRSSIDVFLNALNMEILRY